MDGSGRSAVAVFPKFRSGDDQLVTVEVGVTSKLLCDSHKESSTVSC